MTLRDCLRPCAPAECPTPQRVYRALADYALRRGVEVVQTDLRDPESAMFVEEGVLGTIGRHGLHHVVFVDENQDAEEKALTLAHELSHTLLEYGPTPPEHNSIVDVHGMVEPRAYGTEALVGRAVGLEPAIPGEPADVAAVVGLEPVVLACKMAEAVRQYPERGYELLGYHAITPEA